MVPRDFLHTYSRYYGQGRVGNVMFNSNLQEFAQRISFISNLHTGGKMTSEEAFNQIADLWQALESSKINLDASALLGE
ncbi:hypothetical protein [Pseudanabaena sp. FACHB-2040]|uniref:DUF7219 family protein n=1 Tax=Pseudanabaena sp. FACHB-2040 TaxID=2692859 RepID=UPI0016845809|nr:hypothetical protein [Pseudanabaena sp. FACHB-2040]MBD2256170.1 hypothetical protein [Pseudanabaena sp. FACHB-2040]